MGGAIYNTFGTLTVVDSIISENSGWSGGGIFNDRGTLTLINSALSGNRAFFYGGGIFNLGGPLSVTNSALSGNRAFFWGGGIFSQASSHILTITGSALSGNTAAEYGGGIYHADGWLWLTNSIISGNGGLYGGGIYSTSSDLIITDSTLSGNSATIDGGGIHNTGSRLSITNSTVSGNTAGRNGGGIYNFLYHSIIHTTVMNSTISGNSAFEKGGGIYLGRAFTFPHRTQILNSTVSENEAAIGGGIYSDHDLRFLNSTISRNSATTSGGGIFIEGGFLSYANMIVANSISGGDCVIHGGTIGSNTNNLVEDGSCSATLSGDPKLGPLANNGGFTQTHALLAGSPAIDAADDDFCESSDQRGIPRPQGAHCDIGAFELETSVDSVPPVVASIARADPNPTGTASVNFVVTFSESVSGVDAADFALTSSGVTNETINGVAGTGTQYTVTVETGSGDGTIRLDVVDDDSILDAAGNPLGGAGAGNGNFSSGEVYDIQRNEAPTDIELSASTIAENLPAGTTVGTLATIDPEAGDTHTYSFCGGTDDASFALAGNALNTAAMFNYEVQNTFPICIRSTDAGGRFIDKAFQILVQDVAENVAPETRIIKLKVKRGVYTFFFTSSASDSTFMCRLDQDVFVPCTNPANYSGLSAGSHAFQVYAIDPSGNPDLTPAEYQFTVNQ